MSLLNRIRIAGVSILVTVSGTLSANGNPNQTPTVSPIFPESKLPFSISIDEVDFVLPNGIHSGAFATYHNKWLFIAGRTNGLHGFDDDDNNFPVSQQNTVVYVIDLKHEVVYSRALDDPTSGLTQDQIDLLSVTSPQFFQKKKKLYMSGGYGVDTNTGLFSTKPVLTAINIPGLIKWVIDSDPDDSAAQHIRQTTHPILQVTGGYMDAINSDLSTLLVFGQNFDGFYRDSSNGEYTQQVRRFKIIDTHKDFSIQLKNSRDPDPDYRRRDLNIVPVILDGKRAYVALSGVFTENGGIWTVPVVIQTNGNSSMADPSNPNTFKQGMNNYVSPTIGLYSKSKKSMFITVFGGISYGYFQGDSFETDEEIPFINQVTTVKIDKRGKFKQYLMDNEYPVILSTGSNPGNQLLFGAAATFIPKKHRSTYSNGVLKLDKLKGPTVLGYIVGGIMSTLPNTNTESDSTASPYIFRITLNP